MPTNFKGQFFKPEPSLAIIAKNKPLILDLIKQIALFKSSFEEQLKQAPTKDHQELQDAIERSDLRLRTLENLKEDKNVSAEDGKLLIDYIKTMHITGAKVYEDIHEEPAPDSAAPR